MLLPLPNPLTWTKPCSLAMFLGKVQQFLLSKAKGGAQTCTAVASCRPLLRQWCPAADHYCVTGMLKVAGKAGSRLPAPEAAHQLLLPFPNELPSSAAVLLPAPWI